MANDKNNVFIYEDSKHVKHEICISPEDLSFVQVDKKISDVGFKTKPTTFFKDAMRRFAKNKSSVIAAGILGFIISMAVILPAAIPSDISHDHPYETKLQPKLFDSGTGWWDGCKDMKKIIDVDWDKYEAEGVIEGLPVETAEKDIVGGRAGVKMTKIGDRYVNSPSPYAHGGFVRLIHTSNNQNRGSMASHALTFDFAAGNEYDLSFTTGNPEEYKDYTFGPVVGFDVYFQWVTGNETHRVTLAEGVPAIGTMEIDLMDHLAEIEAEAGVSNPVFSKTENTPRIVFEMENIETTAKDTNVLFSKVVLTTNVASAQESFEKASIHDANDTLVAKDADKDWVYSNATFSLFHADVIYGTYRFDTYENAYGNFKNDGISMAMLEDYERRGWISVDWSLLPSNWASMSPKSVRDAAVQPCVDSIVVLDAKHCPIVLDADHPLKANTLSAGGITAFGVSGTTTRWKILYPGRESMPRFLFGTDVAGRDMLKYVFDGLRTSLILGTVSFLVCFTFGLFWGAISGYFGGWTDLVMERLTDILSGIPWMVMMTLAIIKFGSNFVTFTIAICLTGWIGTASLTRTQFYRFKDREYIFAARTLGASDFRLIFRHILPNAVGTIITSAVLMIPSVIYSEATLAYLNLGLQGLSSLGVILSDNQSNIENNPYLILFPSAVMALLMISFNLFGNGLRDAFNPSLKGQD